MSVRHIGFGMNFYFILNWIHSKSIAFLIHREEGTEIHVLTRAPVRHERILVGRNMKRGSSIPGVTSTSDTLTQTHINFFETLI